ncbi:MAG: glycerate kinase [Myxococcota bacterium]
MSAKGPLRVVVAPQEFKGTLSAAAAAEAIRRGLHAARPDWQLSLFPLADGGPGTVELVLARVPGAQRRMSRVADPLGRPVDAAWAVLPPGDVAVLEMAQASGLTRLTPQERRPLDASTTGTGQLIRAALDAGCRRIIVGAGGSATTDGGAGALNALGVRFLDGEARVLEPTPRRLAGCASLDTSGLDHRLARAELEVWTDVKSPLLGPSGASHLFARQKGATGWDVVFLEGLLRRLTGLVSGGAALARAPGSGAAGGLAWGLSSLCNATLRPGFLSLAALVGLDRQLAGAQLVVTGEGRLDAQTPADKGPWGLAQLARRHRCRVVAFVGACELPASRWKERFDEVVSLGPPHGEPAAALERCARAWAETSSRATRT